MTDEERAEKYLYEIVSPKRLEPTVLNANKEIVNAHIAGLAEGRKLGKEEQWLATEKAQKKTSARIKELEKENAELKEENVRLNQQVKDLKDFVETLSKEHANEWEQQQNIITKMRCCENCEDYSKQYETTGCPDCIDLSHWRIKP